MEGLRVAWSVNIDVGWNDGISPVAWVGENELSSGSRVGDMVGLPSTAAVSISVMPSRASFTASEASMSALMLYTCSLNSLGTIFSNFTTSADGDWSAFVDGREVSAETACFSRRLPSRIFSGG